MKKGLVFVLVVSMIASLFTAMAWAQPPDPEDLSRLTIPDYHKLDPELVKDNKVKGEVVRGKEFKANGKSYIKPIAGNSIEPLDVRTKDAKGIAILVDFPTNGDGSSAVPGVNYPQVPMQKFDDLLNGTTYNPFELETFSWLASYNGVAAPTDRTMRNYYNEVSYDQYQIDVDVVGWYTVSHPYEYYLGQNQGYFSNENGDARIGDLVLEAVKLADADVDFAQYAIDGEVPNIFIIHRGTGAEYSRDPEIIWSHKWNILSARYYGHYYRTGQYLPNTPAVINELIEAQIVDGVIVDTYNIVPEVGQDISGFLGSVRKPSPAYAGVYAHEFGHILGLPDQYDYGYESEGTGMFTLMAGGSYGRSIAYRWYSGNSPVHMNAWDKYYLGFADPIEINENKSIMLRPVSDYPDIFKIIVPGSEGREYFLLENRQQKDFDEGLSYNIDGKALHGLVVYHIVDDMIIKSFNRPNEAQNWDPNHLGASQQGMSQYGQTHYGFSVIQADGQFNLERGNNDADAGDVFPGKYGVTSLRSKGNGGANTTSVFKWDKKSTETGINLENIVEKADGTITCDVVFTK